MFYRDMGHDYPEIVRGEGVYLYDANGKQYIDASGGPLVVSVGHGVASIARAMAAQAERVAYVHGSLFTTEALETYSERLAPKVPLREPRFYYLSSGSEAVETALKFARQVQLARGEASRDVVISRWGSYHGVTLGTLGVSGKASMRAPYEPMFRDAPHVEAPYCYRCPFDLACPECELACARQLEAAILDVGPERVAAFLAEPVGGATLGAIVPPLEYWTVVRDICDRYSLLLIADEVLTGFGRTGAWFAMEHFGVEPDVMTLAKGAAGGYFPLSIAAVRGTDVEAIRLAHGNFNHGGTFSHHAVGSAAALATMDYLEAHDLVARAARMGDVLGAALRGALEDVPAAGDVRGVGMMWAVEFVADRETKEPYPKEARFADRVCAACMAQGVLLYPGHGSAGGGRGDHLMVAPPYVVTEEQIATIVDLLRRAVMASAVDW